MIIALRVLRLEGNDFLEGCPGLGIIAFESIDVPQGNKIDDVFVVILQISLAFSLASSGSLFSRLARARSSQI
jgi:hypothetical protein